MSTDDLLVEMKKISKRFGGVKALDEVDFEVKRNEIVGLVGDNGAGKSTLIKILAGVFKPDSGKIFIEGEEVRLSHPSEGRELGIRVIYQDLALVDSFDVPSNFFLGNEITKKVGGIFKLISQKKMSRISQEVIQERLGVNIKNWYEPVRVLSGGERQSIAVAKAVYDLAKLIIMDEPTAALGVSETEKLFSVIKKLKNDGLTIIVIAHNLEHVFRIADRIVILYQGRRVGERIVSETSKSEIVNLMLGAV